MNTRYINEEFIFAGSQGRVYKAYDTLHNSHVVVKKFNKSTTSANETNILSYICQHTTDICPMYIEYKDNILVMEYLGKYQCLIDIYSTLDIYQINLIARDMIYKLDILHGLGITHQDIKPDNIMVNLETFQIRYIDFGMSIHNGEPNGEGVAGTIFYVSPLYLRSYDHLTLDIINKNDKWSLAISIYMTITWINPYSWLGYANENMLKIQIIGMIRKLTHHDVQKFFDHPRWVLFERAIPETAEIIRSYLT